MGLTKKDKIKTTNDLAVYNLHLFERFLIELKNSAVEVTDRCTDALNTTE